MVGCYRLSDHWVEDIVFNLRLLLCSRGSLIVVKTSLMMAGSSIFSVLQLTVSSLKLVVNYFKWNLIISHQINLYCLTFFYFFFTWFRCECEIHLPNQFMTLCLGPEIISLFGYWSKLVNCLMLYINELFVTNEAKKPYNLRVCLLTTSCVVCVIDRQVYTVKQVYNYD